MKPEEWEKWKDMVPLTEAMIAEAEKQNDFLMKHMNEPIKVTCEICRANDASIDRVVISRKTGKAHPEIAHLCEKCANDLDKKYRKFEF